MRLTELTGDTRADMQSVAALHSIEISGLTLDSRKVEEGFLFAALPGAQADGRRFAAQAVRQGAVAILAPQGTSFADCGLEDAALSHNGQPVQLLTDTNPRRRIALMAARFYGTQPRVVAAVTGTNGKTSIAAFTRQIWIALGHKAASLGTLGLVPPRPDGPASLTTPDPVDLQRCLAALAADDFDHLVIEASSHGLDQCRLDGVGITAAAFTNLTRDHLDYHATMQDYLAAKLRLFRELLADSGCAVLNRDLEVHDRDVFEQIESVCKDRGLRILTYATAPDLQADLRLLSRQPVGDGQRLEIEAFGERYELHLALAGDFQASNVLAAAGLAVASGSEPRAVMACLPDLQGVPGRVEQVARTPCGGSVYVDYAHTPDALQTVLSALRPHTTGRLWVVVGCGGDRDRGKRPLMGEIAARLADEAIITDDNPRGEDPAAIRGEILAAAPHAKEIGDRRAAIVQAMTALCPGDVLVIAGKGHEAGQIVGGQVLPFDDRDVARATAGRLSDEEGRP